MPFWTVIGPVGVGDAREAVMLGAEEVPETTSVAEPVAVGTAEDADAREALY